MPRLLEVSAFRHRDKALSNVAPLSRLIPETEQRRLFLLISASPDPDSSLHALARFAVENPPQFERIVSNSSLVLPLVTVFANSRFLADEVIQHPEWLEDAVLGGDLHRSLTQQDMELRLLDFLRQEGVTRADALHFAQFRRRQLLRILLRDVSGLATLAEVTAEISALAGAILSYSLQQIRGELASRYGTPMTDSGPCGFSVIALGKLGGEELNYSSDIDLMFVYGGNGETDGPRSISNKEFFKKVANEYTNLLSTYTPEGLCYRVDLRLRPDGKLGEVCMSLDGARQYYRQRARDWELQMLIKARHAAGDPGPARELLEFVEPLIYSSTLDFSAVEAVSEARLRIQEKLHQRRGLGANELDVKLAPGGIRDIEFLVQCLQRLHGGREPWVRHGGTLLALFRLRDKNLLSDSEYSNLCEAYEFLRHLEHRLQFADDRQTHVMPADREQIEVLARQMPGQELGQAADAGTLLARLQEHLERVREIYERVIHSQQPMYYNPTPPPQPQAAATAPEPVRADALDSNLLRFLDQKAPGFAATLQRMRPRRGARAFERYLEWVVPNQEWLGWLDSDPVLAGYLVDIFEHSVYFSDQLMRFPEMIGVLHAMREKPHADIPLQEAYALDDPNDLRRFFRREMFRIQAEGISLGTPIFTTLARTSHLADAAINAAYRFAVNQVTQSHPPGSSSYAPKDQMMVIALGRLGMTEFDLASDADLVFVLPDDDEDERLFWNRVATKTIDRLSTYTREGAMFAVDTRLRPNGREGELVQLASNYRDYFSQKAEAWEGLAYMKARAVAGNLERGTDFLNELQTIDWRRYGQSGRSQKLLRQMRMRLEKEQGESNPLKAGRGGFYDIDFALLYLRLKSAGIFYRVLNTPERIDVIEKMGHLERSDAHFLRDAATLYRAVDHGLRVLSGQAEGFLPGAPAQLEMLTSLVSRWTPEHLHDQPLEQELEQVRNRTREFFDRLFAG